MIEIPRAALLADEIATEAEFFSYGTNDLTQMTFGFSRDDAGKFLGEYESKKIFDFNPFSKLDQNGVGKLIKMSFELGRKSNPHLHVGICGEHGGDPETIEFLNEIGIDYVSCSPFRVPIARLAAAQANYLIWSHEHATLFLAPCRAVHLGPGRGDSVFRRRPGRAGLACQAHHLHSASPW